MDETQQCEKCGCGMIDAATGWQCPECRHIVESEPARVATENQNQPTNHDPH